MKRPSYRAAIAWIAEVDPIDPDDYNDELEQMEGHVSVALVADMFGIERSRVVRDVLRCVVRKVLYPGGGAINGAGSPIS
jgi:hypothetical protein